MGLCFHGVTLTSVRACVSLCVFACVVCVCMYVCVCWVRIGGVTVVAAPLDRQSCFARKHFPTRTLKR